MSKEEMLNLLDVMERRIAYGQPYGELMDKLRAALSEPKKCKYGDPMCPCQDGDMCHYEGENPMTPPASDPVQPVSPLTLAGWCLEAMTDVADWGGYASAYFQEKHRLQEDIDKWKKRAEQCRNAAPQGYVMVPVEPTEEMRREFEDYYHGAKGYQHNPFKSAYKAMLSAAKKGGE